MADLLVCGTSAHASAFIESWGRQSWTGRLNKIGNKKSINLKQASKEKQQETYNRMKMSGSVDHQINKIFVDSGIFQPGASKHDAKEAARESLQQNGLTASSQAVAEMTGIYSYETARDYKDVWHDLGHFAKSEMGLKDMTELGREHAQTYLESRMDSISYGTWQREAAAIGKLQSAIEKYTERMGMERHCDLRDATRDPELRAVAKDVLDDGQKSGTGFENPREVTANLDEEKAVVAAIQEEVLTGMQY